jgi:hypothetical protein
MVGHGSRIVETGQSGERMSRDQAARKSPWGVSIPLPYRASGPYRRLRLQGEPEILTKKGRSGKEFHVTKAFLIEMHVEIPRGEKNTPGRRSNNAVGDGDIVVNSQEMSGLSEFLEREPKILEKTINEDPRNIECSMSLAGGPKTASDLCDIFPDQLKEILLFGRMSSSEEFLSISLSGRMSSLKEFLSIPLSGRLSFLKEFLSIP